MVHDDIKKLIRKHDYEIKIDALESGMVRAYFPERQEQPFCSAFTNTYEYKEGGIKCLFEESHEEFIKAPLYAFRAIIYADVLRMCGIMGYKHDLVGFYAKEKEISREEFNESIMPKSLNKRQKKQDAALECLLQEGMVSGFDDGLQHDAEITEVSKGYQIVRNILAGGL